MGETHIWISRLSKEDCPHQSGWATVWANSYSMNEWMNPICSISLKNPNIDFGVLMRLAFEMVDSVKQISLPSMGGHHPIH